MVVDILLGGLTALKDYIALHVLTCLIPAFLLAGAIVTFISREAIIGYLGALSPQQALCLDIVVLCLAVSILLLHPSGFLNYRPWFIKRKESGGQ